MPAVADLTWADEKLRGIAVDPKKDIAGADVRGLA
jgi:hypothetical protein